jgi:hypothetical protein
MRLHQLDYIFWCSAPIVQCCVLVAISRRGLYRQYPFFFNYTVWQTLSVPVLMMFRGWVNYYYVYFVAMALSTLLSFAVLQDLIKNGLQTTEPLSRLSSRLLASTLIILVAIQTVATGIHGWVELDSWMALILSTQRTAQILQIGLLVLFFSFGKSTGISRGSVLYGIALGFGLSAAVNMVTRMLMAHHSIFSRRILTDINSVAYLVACGVWLVYAMRGSSGESGYWWKRVVPL